jgi:hypothetical protein
MTEFKDFYVVKKPDNTELECLVQLLRIVWDGDVISKTERDSLVSKGFAVRVEGFQVITAAGIRFLLEKGIIDS